MLNLVVILVVQENDTGYVMLYAILTNVKIAEKKG